MSTSSSTSSSSSSVYLQSPVSAPTSSDNTSGKTKRKKSAYELLRSDSESDTERSSSSSSSSSASSCSSSSSSSAASKPLKKKVKRADRKVPLLDFSNDGLEKSPDSDLDDEYKDKDSHASKETPLDLICRDYIAARSNGELFMEIVHQALENIASVDYDDLFDLEQLFCSKSAWEFYSHLKEKQPDGSGLIQMLRAIALIFLCSRNPETIFSSPDVAALFEEELKCWIFTSKRLRQEWSKNGEYVGFRLTTYNIKIPTENLQARPYLLFYWDVVASLWRQHSRGNGPSRIIRDQLSDSMEFVKQVIASLLIPAEKAYSLSFYYWKKQNQTRVSGAKTQTDVKKEYDAFRESSGDDLLWANFGDSVYNTITGTDRDIHPEHDRFTYSSPQYMTPFILLSKIGYSMGTRTARILTSWVTRAVQEWTERWMDFSPREPLTSTDLYACSSDIIYVRTILPRFFADRHLKREFLRVQNASCSVVMAFLGFNDNLKAEIHVFMRHLKLLSTDNEKRLSAARTGLDQLNLDANRYEKAYRREFCRAAKLLPMPLLHLIYEDYLYGSKGIIATVFMTPTNFRCLISYVMAYA